MSRFGETMKDQNEECEALRDLLRRVWERAENALHDDDCDGQCFGDQNECELAVAVNSAISEQLDDD